MSKIDTISLEEFDDKWDNFRTYTIEFPETYGNCNGDGCPVNFCNELTEYSQNMGCLPTPYDIVYALLSFFALIIYIMILLFLLLCSI